MRLIKMGAAVLNQTPLDWEGNRERIVRVIREARRAGVTLLCLPEMCIPGYGCEDAFHSPNTHLRSWEMLEELLPETRGMVVSVGLPVVYHNGLYNAAALLVDGELAGLTAKQYLAGDGIHYEPRWFKAWPRGRQGRVKLGGREYPIGDLYFDVGGVKIGFEICEDAWVARRPGSDLAPRGVDVVLNPSASHFAFGKHEVRKRFVTEGARAFGVTYVYANLLGNDAGRVIYDGGAMIASGGELLVRGPRLTFSESELITAVVDVEQTRVNRIRTVSFIPHVGDDEGLERVSLDYRWPDQAPEPPHGQPRSWESSATLKEEEFTRATALGLFDYLRKSYSRGFVVSLSGGADSSAVATLCAQMVEFGISELGLEGFLGRLAHVPAVAEAKNAAEVIGGLLTCVYQSTRNSSETTRGAASGLAEALGADFHHLDIDELVQRYVAMTEQALGRALTWEADDITLQNIQARVRSPSIWMWANIRGALLLSTSNRSEAAVGYATMDGDTSGGLSPIAGIDKAFLRRWLVWMEVHGPEGYGPVPALGAVTRQVPTAELRPSEAEQTDEGDLMPYELLDAIERHAIRDKRSPLEVFVMLRAEHPEYEAGRLGVYVERFFRLWCRNQWKRERYAPSFHVDDKNLDPKTWCRFPILSGGFDVELRELREHLASCEGRGEDE